MTTNSAIFTALWSDPSGHASNITKVQLGFQTPPAAAPNFDYTTTLNGCALFYLPGTQTLYIGDGAKNQSPADSSPIGPAGHTLSSTACLIDAANTHYTITGVVATLTVPVTFINSQATSYSVFGSADNAVAATNWFYFEDVTPQVSGPLITGMSPISGWAGTQITITGSGFGSTQGSVTFNGKAATISNWGPSQIIALVPAGATSGPVTVFVGGVVAGVIPGLNFQFQVTQQTTPTITSVSPSSGPVGTALTIIGNNFGPTCGSPCTVYINGTLATPTSWSNTTITTSVPVGVPTTGAGLWVQAGSYASSDFPFTVSPHITSVSPAFGKVGTTSVDIFGSNLGRSGTVTFHGAVVTPASWTDQQIHINAVPCAATTGDIVVTRVDNFQSSTPFTVNLGQNQYVGLQQIPIYGANASGDPTHRVQLVFMGDGYTSDMQ